MPGMERMAPKAFRSARVATIGLWLLLLVSALNGLERADALLALVAACALGRWGALLHALLAPPARADGLGAAFRVTGPPFGLATVLAAVAALGAEGPPRAAAVAAAAILTTAAVTAWARGAIGGRTGDTLGACVALTEVVVCLVTLAFL